MFFRYRINYFKKILLFTFFSCFYRKLIAGNAIFPGVLFDCAMRTARRIIPKAKKVLTIFTLGLILSYGKKISCPGNSGRSGRKNGFHRRPIFPTVIATGIIPA
jgi:hypothetical protein